MGPELGTGFDMGQRLFAYYGAGDVFDYGEYGARELRQMFSRNGTASALEMVLTLPIREADFSIEPAKGDSGECDFARSVLLTPDDEGGMKTPFTELLGQVTSAQIFKKAFFEKTFRQRELDGKIIYNRIAYRPPATCQARYNDRTGEGNGFRQQVWLFGGNLMLSRQQKVPGYVDIPKVRSYIYVHGKHREPLTGTSELEVTYWALAHGSQVQTPDGPVPIEDIQVGDVVFGGDGDLTRVTAVHPRGKRQMYRVTFSDKTSVECDEEHLWEVEGRTGSSFRIPPQSMVITTRAMRAAGLRIGTHYRYYLPLCDEVAYPERELPIDPYVLGAWLGDGCIGKVPDGSRTGTPFMSCADPDSFIIEEMRSRLPAEIELRRSGGNNDGTCANYHIVDTLHRRQNSFRDSLVTLGINKTAGDKSIPEIYLLASPKQRWDLLRGLMDTDGGSDQTRDGTDRSLFGTSSRQLALDVQRLVESLGGKASLTANTVNSNFGASYMYRVEVRTPRNPFLLPRKAALWKGGETRRSFTRSVVSIEPTTEQECTCITVAAKDGLFLTNHFIRTHNCHQTQMKLLLEDSSYGTASSRAWHCSASSCTATTSPRPPSAPTTSPSSAAQA